MRLAEGSPLRRLTVSHGTGIEFQYLKLLIVFLVFETLNLFGGNEFCSAAVWS
jgi:hypothetical protein